MKKSLLILLAFIGGLQLKGASVLPAPVPPRDLPVIEALISLHKTMASAENEALSRLNISLAETNRIKKNATDFKEIREVLDTRTTSIYSNLVLAARIAYVTKNLYDFTKLFTQFSAASASTLFKKPMCAWYYTEAVSACAKEVKNMTETMTRLGVSSINLITATMDEKLQLINTIDATIERCKRIIDETYMWCSFVVNGGHRRLFLWDILNSTVTDQIAKGIISQYA